MSCTKNFKLLVSFFLAKSILFLDKSIPVTSKPNLLKSTLEIIFATVFIPIVVVAITTFTTNDFALFNLMEPFILEWWNDR